jgi:hypothetical protein
MTQHDEPYLELLDDPAPDAFTRIEPGPLTADVAIHAGLVYVRFLAGPGAERAVLSPVEAARLAHRLIQAAALGVALAPADAPEGWA